MAALVVALPSLARADGVYENCAPSSQCERRLNQLPSRGLGPVLNYWVYQGYQGPGSVIAYARNAWAHGTKLIWPIRSDWTRRQVRWYVTMARDLPATWGYYVGEEGHVTRYAGRGAHSLPMHPRPTCWPLSATRWGRR